MTVRAIAFGLTVALMGAAAAHAQDAPVAQSRDLGAPPAVPVQAPRTTAAQTTAEGIASAASSLAAPAASNGKDETAAQIDAWVKSDARAVQPLDPNDALPIEAAPRQIHGEVTATVSNRGYAGSAAASIPIGDASELDVAVGGAHVRTPYGNFNPRSIAIGLYLDGGDVAHWLSRDKCHVPRWGVGLPNDPQVTADGSCVRGDPAPAATPAQDRDR